MYKVVIADDNPTAKLGLLMLLEDSSIYSIVGEASDGDEAIKQCKELLPDLLLTDLKMPGKSIIENARFIKLVHTGIKIIVLTAFDDSEDIYRAIKAGIDGYLMKSTDPIEILRVIQQVMDGTAYYQSKHNTEFI